LIFETLRLPLSVAQLALLRNLPDVYQDSLTRAQTVLDDRFDLTAADVTAFHLAIEELAGLAVTYNLPDISGSFNALREELHRRGRVE
jgi:uncharacterized protein HemX